MGGASNTSDDRGGGSSYSDQLKKRQKKNPIVEFVKGGGVPGMLYRAVKKGIEKTLSELKNLAANKFVLSINASLNSPFFYFSIRD